MPGMLGGAESLKLADCLLQLKIKAYVIEFIFEVSSIYLYNQIIIKEHWELILVGFAEY